MHKVPTRQKPVCEDKLSSYVSLNHLLIGFKSTIATVILAFIFKYYSQLIANVYESGLWWSNIQLVEKEISFRTESGLFYSYYKQIVQSPTILQGINDLIHDNRTEHPTEINVIKRMNIAQEIIVASIYKTFTFIQKVYSPIDFYIQFIFYLHGFLLCVIFLIGWILGKSILTGICSVVLYIANRGITTRVFVAAPLRESWALPFFWSELLFLTILFKPKHYSKMTKVFLQTGLFFSILFFCLFWQFNQFLLLVQTISVFASVELGIIPFHKSRVYYISVISSLVIVAVQQFGNFMLINSFCLSVCMSGLFVHPCLIRLFDRYHRDILSGLVILVIRVLIVIICAFLFFIFTKIIFNQENDSHIFRFLLNKFGLADNRDFDVRLYVCNGGFNWMELSTFTSLHSSGALIPYVCAHAVVLVITAFNYLVKIWNGQDTTTDNISSNNKCVKIIQKEDNLLRVMEKRPELAFNSIQLFLFFLLALSTQRLMVLWSPHALIFASLMLTDKDFYCYIIKKILSYFKSPGKNDAELYSNFKFDNAGRILICGIICTLFLGILSYSVYNEIHYDLNNLREFYDPDTVELMNWISKSTNRMASFTGSMQLLAGVKLCTGRHILNHPHYEDKNLRLKTKKLYQMYGRMSPDVVHSILVSYKANYIILEDSICLAASNGCRLPDHMDIVNGQVADNGVPEFSDLVYSSTPRFCDEIRYSHEAGQSNLYRKYFRLVFINKTFRVYRVL